MKWNYWAIIFYFGGLIIGIMLCKIYFPREETVYVRDCDEGVKIATINKLMDENSMLRDSLVKTVIKKNEYKFKLNELKKDTLTGIRYYQHILHGSNNQ